MSEYVQMIPEDSVEEAFYRSVTAVQGERYPQARQVGEGRTTQCPYCLYAAHSSIQFTSDFPPVSTPPLPSWPLSLPLPFS